MNNCVKITMNISNWNYKNNTDYKQENNQSIIKRYKYLSILNYLILDLRNNLNLVFYKWSQV